MTPSPSPPDLSLNLLVIRSAIPAELAAFYTQLGLQFDYHQHGKGPWHYAATIGGLTLEIYPLKRSQKTADTHLRLGFTVADIAAVMEVLQTDVLTEPTITEWGLRAVVVDPEGRRVELVQQ